MLKIKIFSIAISLILVASAFCGVTMASFAIDMTANKTIIILPGLFASGLYNTENNEPVWDPFYDLDLKFSDIMDETGALTIDKFIGDLLKAESFQDHLDRLVLNDCYGTPDSLFNLIAMNEDGTPEVPTVKRVPWTEDGGRLRYGVANAQKGMYQYLNQLYGRNYFVQVYNYDFRDDVRKVGKELEEYINGQGYEEVILVAHSNGGVVASSYLARSEANRQKVKKFISYNVPFLGSFAAISIIENLDGMVGGLGEVLPAALSGLVEDVFDRQFKKIANMWTVYQLLPSFDMLTNTFMDETAAIYIKENPQGKPNEENDNPYVKLEFDNDEELWDFYCSRPWAKMSNGELRPAMVEWLDYKRSIFVDNGSGERVHVSRLVDTTYFNGEGKSNVCQLYMYEDEFGALKVDEDLTVRTTHGDGTVPAVSGTAGSTDTNRFKQFVGFDHYGVVVNYDLVASELTKQAIDEYLKNNQSYMDKIF